MERSPAQKFEDLIVWQKAHQFVLDVYQLTKSFPREELYGLSSQFRRAAVSIAANIAEGFKKRGRADKVRFMNIAQGSRRSAGITWCSHETWDMERHGGCLCR